MYAWKNIQTGEVAQQMTAPSADNLFENSGFGAVRVHEPIKGYLAVEVERLNGRLVEIAKPEQDQGVS